MQLFVPRTCLRRYVACGICYGGSVTAGRSAAMQSANQLTSHERFQGSHTPSGLLDSLGHVSSRTHRLAG